MKFTLLFYLLAASLIAAPDTTRKPEGGRIIKPVLQCTAHDDGGMYIFKSPHNIVACDDGAFFVIDNARVLKFDKAGKFSAIIVDKGQGPGEATHLLQLYPQNNEVVVNTGFMTKLIFLPPPSAAGPRNRYNREYERRSTVGFTGNSGAMSEGTFHIVGHTKKNDFVVMKTEYLKGNQHRSSEKNNTATVSVWLLSSRNVWKKKLFEIPVKAYTVKTRGGCFSVPVFPVLTANTVDHIYYCNTDRYEIKVYNIAENKIETTWKREKSDYQPVPIPEKDRERYRPGGTFISSDRGKSKKFEPPPQKYFRDIQDLQVVNGCLWVFTSVAQREKGVLVDVFNFRGENVDRFYLYFPRGVDLHDIYRSQLYIRGGHLYVRQRDREDNHVIARYNFDHQFQSMVNTPVNQNRVKN